MGLSSQAWTRLTILSPQQIHIHLESHIVTLFRNKVFIDELYMIISS